MTILRFVLLLALSWGQFSFAQLPSSGGSVADGEARESPWLLTPLITAEPKLGTTIGGMGAYIKKFDEQSDESMFGVFGTYSETESWITAFFADVYFDNNKQKILAAAVAGEINNEFKDFLGTGETVETTDNLKMGIFRYSHLIAKNWYLGGQIVSSDYEIGADGVTGIIFDLIGFTGFNSTGVGLVGEYDGRDHPRNPKTGNQFVVNNIAYRESLGGDESFDVYRADYHHYFPVSDKWTLATQVRGRWTQDAPLGAYSTVMLRGYVAGNFLAPHYTHIDFDNRYWFKPRWGISVFAGVACLYDDGSDCNDSDNIYPAAGAGLMYLLKEDAGMVLRAEVAVGKDGNEGFYLKFGHPF
jgi:hypothetical protein